MSEISLSEFNFGEELKECINNEDINREFEGVLDYNSVHIKDLQNLLHINLLEHNDKYIKEDFKVNIKEIVSNYKTELSSNDLMEFSGIINGLWEEGYIEGEDYFITMKWIMEEL